MVDVSSQRENGSVGKRKSTGPTPLDHSNKRARFGAQQDSSTEDGLDSQRASQNDSPLSLSASQTSIASNKQPKYYECPEPYIDDDDDRETWQSYLRPSLTMLITQVVSRPETNYSYESILLMRHLCSQYNEKEDNLLDFLENKVGIWNLTKHAKKVGGFDFELKRADVIHGWILHYHSVMKTINCDMRKWQTRKDSMVYQFRGTKNYIPFTWTKLEITSLATFIIQFVMEEATGCDMSSKELQSEFASFAQDVLIMFAKNKRMAINFNRMMVSCFDNMALRSQEHDNDLVRIWSNRNGDGAQLYGELVHQDAADFANTEDEYRKMSTNILKMMDEAKIRKRTTAFTKKQIRARLLAANPTKAKKIARANGQLRSQLSREFLDEAEKLNKEFTEETRRVYWNFLCTKAYLMYINEGDAHHPPAEIREAVRFLVDEREPSPPDKAKLHPSPAKLPGLCQPSDDSTTGSDDEEPQEECTGTGGEQGDEGVNGGVRSSDPPSQATQDTNGGKESEGSAESATSQPLGPQDNDSSKGTERCEKSSNAAEHDGLGASTATPQEPGAEKKAVSFAREQCAEPSPSANDDNSREDKEENRRRLHQSLKETVTTTTTTTVTTVATTSFRHAGSKDARDRPQPLARKLNLTEKEYQIGPEPQHTLEAYLADPRAPWKTPYELFFHVCKNEIEKQYGGKIKCPNKLKELVPFIKNYWDKLPDDDIAILNRNWERIVKGRSVPKEDEITIQHIHTSLDLPSLKDPAYRPEFWAKASTGSNDSTVPQGEGTEGEGKDEIPNLEDENHGTDNDEKAGEGKVGEDEQPPDDNFTPEWESPPYTVSLLVGESVSWDPNSTKKVTLDWDGAIGTYGVYVCKYVPVKIYAALRKTLEAKDLSVLLGGENKNNTRVLNWVTGLANDRARPRGRYFRLGGNTYGPTECPAHCVGGYANVLHQKSRALVNAFGLALEKRTGKSFCWRDWMIMTTVGKPSHQFSHIDNLDAYKKADQDAYVLIVPLGTSCGMIRLDKLTKGAVDYVRRNPSGGDDAFLIDYTKHRACAVQEYQFLAIPQGCALVMSWKEFHGGHYGRPNVEGVRLFAVFSTVKWDDDYTFKNPQAYLDAPDVSPAQTFDSIRDRLETAQITRKEYYDACAAQTEVSEGEQEEDASEEVDEAGDSCEVVGQEKDADKIGEAKDTGEVDGEAKDANKTDKKDEHDSEVVVLKVVPGSPSSEMNDSEEEESSDDDEEGFSPKKVGNRSATAGGGESELAPHETEGVAARSPMPIKEFPNKKNKYRLCTNKDLDGRVFDFVVRSKEAGAVYCLEQHPLQVWTTTREHEHVCAYRIKTDGGDYPRDSDSVYPVLNLVRGVPQFRTYCGSVAGVRLAEGSWLMGWDCLREITINHQGQLYLCLRLDVIMDAILVPHTKPVEKKDGFLSYRLPSSYFGGEDNEGYCEYCIHRVFVSNFGNNKEFLGQVGKIAKFAWGCHNNLRSVKPEVVEEWEKGKAGNRLRKLLGIKPSERMGFQKAVVEVYKADGVFVHDFSKDTIVKMAYQYTVRVCLPVASSLDGKIYQTIFKFECGRMSSSGAEVPFKV